MAGSRCDPNDLIESTHGGAWIAAAALSVSACGDGAAGALPAAFEQPQRAKASALLTDAAATVAAAAPAAIAAASPTPSADALMNWAQQIYPDWFPGAPATRTLDPYVYRHYENSGNYIGVAGGRVYVLGPVSGGQLLDVGALADFASLVATDYRVAKPASDEEAARFLLQAQLSARRAEIARVRSLGYAGWFDEQVAASPGITAWDWLDSRGYTVINQYGYYDNGYQIFFALGYQLLGTPVQLRQRMALALSEFFVGALDGVMSGWRSWVICDYWDLLTANAFGNFRTLLGKVSMHSAIGQLLSVVGSEKANPATGQAPDENFAREVMQLFTIGLYELNLDGTEKLDRNGQRIETYDQDDITNLARVFTGYNLALVPQFQITQAGTTFSYPDISQARLPMQCYAHLHSTEEVRFLDVVIAGSTNPQTKAERALDALFKHPNVGPFFGQQMIQRLVTSNPSPAYVERVARVFNDNGSGVRGDLRAVFKAILLDPEARGAGGLASSTFGKLRELMVRVFQFGRSFGLHSKLGSWKLIGLPQAPLYAPSVFGFQRPGHRLPGARTGGRQLLAPEFQNVEEVAVAEYINLIRRISREGFFVPAPDIPAFYANQFDLTIVETPAAGHDVVCSYDDELPLVEDAQALVRHLNLVLAAGQLSVATCDEIVAGLQAQFGDSVRLNSPLQSRIEMLSWAITMVMSTPEYLIQK